MKLLSLLFLSLLLLLGAGCEKTEHDPIYSDFEKDCVESGAIFTKGAGHTVADNGKPVFQADSCFYIGTTECEEAKERFFQYMEQFHGSDYSTSVQREVDRINGIDCWAKDRASVTISAMLEVDGTVFTKKELAEREKVTSLRGEWESFKEALDDLSIANEKMKKQNDKLGEFIKKEKPNKAASTGLYSPNGQTISISCNGNTIVTYTADELRELADSLEK